MERKFGARLVNRQPRSQGRCFGAPYVDYHRGRKDIYICVCVSLICKRKLAELSLNIFIPHVISLELFELRPT